MIYLGKKAKRTNDHFDPETGFDLAISWKERRFWSKTRQKNV